MRSHTISMVQHPSQNSMQRTTLGKSTSAKPADSFNTHKDKYYRLHMPFWLKMSQDIFQMHMDQITD